ncbi:MAG: hypothetical protein KatS3mg068_1579 [Candidatus Sericytochromatia bacterium]|nr:MAG: hypothetical protein KatS3mg068_1579 [Candidatus Sericytochromatia bacterium]
MELQSIFRANLDLSLSSNSGTLVSPRWKESNQIEFQVKHRYVENVVTISPSGSLTINISTLGLSQTNFIYLSTLEPNRSLKIRFNGDINGFDLVPPDATKRVFFCSITNFNNLVVENLSSTDPVTIVYVLLEKA